VLTQTNHNTSRPIKCSCTSHTALLALLFLFLHNFNFPSVCMVWRTCAHLTYFSMNLRWNSERNESLMNCWSFFLSGSDRAQFLKTTSSSQRRFTCAQNMFCSEGFHLPSMITAMFQPLTFKSPF